MNEIIRLKVGKEYYPTNCYIIKDSNNNTIIIDPGYEANKIISEIESNSLKVLVVILTHGHADHLGALEEILSKYKCNVIIHEKDVDGFTNDDKAHFSKLSVKIPLIDKENIITCKDSDILEYGNIKLEVIHTPGHTNGSVCLYEKLSNVLFTGDTLFEECYGRCDLKYSNIDDMGKSLEILFERFSNLIIYPGHEESINIDNIKKHIRLLYALRR